jgi:hypothetical protein
LQQSARAFQHLELEAFNIYFDQLR